MKVTLIDRLGTDLNVVNAARVSFGKKSESLEDKDVKLIKYLAKHKHFSPFGHCFASFHIKAPVFVRAQLVKHEYLRMNEISRRYVDTPPEFYTPDVWRGKPVDKKQGSSGEAMWADSGLYQSLLKSTTNTYNEMIAKGVAPEQARMVLPQSLYTEWHWSGSLDAFANMYNLRSKPDAQEETRLIAEQIGGIMQGLYPHSWEALTNAN